MVLFVDRATRLIVGFFVKNKNEDIAVDIMKRLVVTNVSAPKFTGKDFRFVQSANGEMHSEKVRLYSWTNGIFQRFSSPHHSLSNGPNERAMKKVKDVGRCIKLEKKMPAAFWEYAAEFAFKYFKYPVGKFFFLFSQRFRTVFNILNSYRRKKIL